MTDEKPAEQAELEADAVEEASVDIAPDQLEPQPQPPPPDGADDFKPTSADLVVHDRDDIYRAFDRADEILILEELQGRMLETFVYSFSLDGKRLTDLSYEGVNEAVRTMNREGAGIKISATPPVVDEITEDGERQIRVMVYAVDTTSDQGRWGTATEPVMMRKRNGEVVWDKFAFTKALNKAQRNALKTFIPAEMRQTLIATFLQDESRVRRLKSVAEASATELPEPAVGPEADEWREKNRAVYEQIREVSTVAIPPGTFNTHFTAADHSVERMQEFNRYLVEKLAQVKEQQAVDAKKQKAKAKKNG